MAPLREVVRYRKAKRGWELVLECAHRVSRRKVPRRARCSECEAKSFNGPLFNWPESRDTLRAWDGIFLDPTGAAANAAG